jgi:predicted GNAT superfamily acetyltransferase
VSHERPIQDPGVITYRDLTTLEEFAAVVELEREIWGPGYDEVVPVPILAVTVKRGGILAGAFDDARMIGFVYSLPGIKGGRPTQWSHMLGVVAGYRRAGIGRALKELQRERALAIGVDLIEWTFDPLQAANAHLNLTMLGAVVHEYEENVYGASSSPLHRGNPTDRFVAEWWIRRPRAAHDAAGAACVNHARPAGEWRSCAGVDLTLDAPRLVVEIPSTFTDMLTRTPDLALEWRFATREIFRTYFERGYRAVHFALDASDRKGHYLLVR